MGNTMDCDSYDERRHPIRLQEIRYYSAWDFADITHQVIVRTAGEEVPVQPRKKRRIEVNKEFEIALFWAYSDEAICNNLLEERMETRRKPLHKYETPTQKAALEVYRSDKEVRDKIRSKCLKIAIKRENLRKRNEQMQPVYHQLHVWENKRVHELEKILAIKKQVLLEYRSVKNENFIRRQRSTESGYTYANLLELYQYGGEGFGNQQHHLECYVCLVRIRVWRNCHICKHLKKEYEGRNIFELSLGCHSDKHQRALLRELCNDCRVRRRREASENEDSSSEEE